MYLTIIALLLISPLLVINLTSISQYLTSISPVSHSISPLSHHYSPLSHLYITIIISPVSHHYFTNNLSPIISPNSSRHYLTRSHSISPVSHQYYLTTISPLFISGLTIIFNLTISPLSHSISPLSHQYSIISPLSHHYYLTSISPLSHQYFASISRPGAAQVNGWTLLHTVSHRPAPPHVVKAVLFRIVPSHATCTPSFSPPPLPPSCACAPGRRSTCWTLSRGGKRPPCTSRSRRGRSTWSRCHPHASREGGWWGGAGEDRQGGGGGGVGHAGGG